MPDAFQPTWSGPNSIHPDDGHPLVASTRELRTRSASPAAPSIDSLFGREDRDGPRPQQTVVVWDAGQSWPGFSLAHLGSAHGPDAPRLHRVLLRQEAAREALADFLITLLPGGNEANRWGVIEVQTAPGDPLGTRVALGLLEQADRAVLLAGGPGDKDLLRRIADFSRSAPWSGPSLLLVSPADKPSRADRLRRSSWPRGLRAHVLEVFAGSEPGWTAQLLSMVLGDGAPADDGGPGPSAATSAAMANGPAASPPTVGAAARPPTAPPAGRPGGLRGAEAALTLATRAPGMRACAIFDASEGRVTACVGALDEAGDAATRAARMLQAHGDAAALDELIWHSATRQYLVLALPGHAPLRLLAVADRAFGELATLRWHLAVARNQLG